MTGGSRGIGFEIAKRFISEGYQVAICSRNTSEVRKAVKKLGDNCSGFICDVSDTRSLDAFVKKVRGKFRKVDVLVNNAGVAVWKNTREQSDKEIETQLRVNLEGLIKTTRKFLPYLNDCVVNIASGAGKKAHPGLGVYSATKFGVRGFTQALALEERKLKVYSVNPGPVATKMTGFHGISAEKVADVVWKTVNGSYGVESGGDVDVWDLV